MIAASSFSAFSTRSPRPRAASVPRAISNASRTRSVVAVSAWEASRRRRACPTRNCRSSVPRSVRRDLRLVGRRPARPSRRQAQARRRLPAARPAASPKPSSSKCAPSMCAPRPARGTRRGRSIRPAPGSRGPLVALQPEPGDPLELREFGWIQSQRSAQQDRRPPDFSDPSVGKNTA